jgi:hypothetical protein
VIEDVELAVARHNCRAAYNRYSLDLWPEAALRQADNDDIGVVELACFALVAFLHKATDWRAAVHRATKLWWE